MHKSDCLHYNVLLEIKGYILAVVCFINGHSNNLLNCKNCELFKPSGEGVSLMERPIIWECEVCGIEVFDKNPTVAYNEMYLHAKSKHGTNHPSDVFNMKKDENGNVMRAGA